MVVLVASLLHFGATDTSDAEREATIRPRTLLFVALLATLSTPQGCEEVASLHAETQAVPASNRDVPQTNANRAAGNRACRRCHEAQFNSYLATAHNRTSRMPEQSTI